MTLRRIPGVFPFVPGISGGFTDSNVIDTVSIGVTPFQSMRTPGATCIVPLQLPNPQISQKWSIQSVSFQAYLGYLNDGSFNANPSYGLLGRIVGGLILDPSIVPTGNGGAQPYISPILPLPYDSSLISTMWDPETDAMPPVIPNESINPPYQVHGPDKTLAISTTLQLPQPIDKQAAVQPNVGIWMEPSILGWVNAQVTNIGLQVINASYAVVYDDGIGNAG